MGYKTSKEDTDLWTKRVNDHYEYIAKFVGDAQSFGKDPLATIEELNKD